MALNLANQQHNGSNNVTCRLPQLKESNWTGSAKTYAVERNRQLIPAAIDIEIVNPLTTFDQGDSKTLWRKLKMSSILITTDCVITLATYSDPLDYRHLEDCLQVVLSRISETILCRQASEKIVIACMRE